MFEIIVGLIVVGVFALIAVLFGVDSRDGKDWTRPAEPTNRA